MQQHGARMPEQRRFDRGSIALPVIAGGSIKCVLLDISRDGAKLTSERPLTDKFYVMLRPDLKRWCKVIWRRRTQVGVKFIPDPQVRTVGAKKTAYL
jgi:hypothetical protein